MKRLIKKANVSLYHGTSIENCKNILESGGITPQGGNGIGMYREDLQDKFNGYVFLTNVFTTAQMYAEDMYYGQETIPSIAVIELELPESELLPDDIDCEECATWQQSLAEVEQLKIKGTVSSSNFKNIHVVTNGNKETFTMNEFLEQYK